VRFTDNNYEDWDFRHCGHDDPEYDVEADLFFTTHFTAAVAVDAMRIGVISTLVDHGIAALQDDHQHFHLVPQADGVLRGWKSGASRFTRAGRFERRVVEGLRRENEKYGRVRATILPRLPGLESFADDR